MVLLSPIRHVYPIRPAIQIIFLLLLNSDCIRIRKASRSSLDHIKFLFGEIQRQSGTFNPLIQLDDITNGIDRKNLVLQSRSTELTINNPDEYFQGDIDLSEKQAELISENLEDEAKKTNSTKSPFRIRRQIGKEPFYARWDRLKPISYEFAASIPYTTREKIQRAIKLWEDKTCVRFRENGPNIDRIEFFDGGGCSSFVGKAGGTQGISIANGCEVIGIISHEIAHALGTFHEQARPDQKDNVFVNYNNINPVMWSNFQPLNPAQIESYDLPYDSGSVMHYGPYSFAEDPYIPTITTRNRLERMTIGQREEPSFLDIEAINMAYRCNEHCPAIECNHGGYANPNDCERCICPNGFGGTNCETVESAICGSLLEVTASPMYIESPLYPDYVREGTKCVWLIQAPVGYSVLLQFVDKFHLSCHKTCDQAYVEVKDRHDFRKTGYRFCCTMRPLDVFKSETNEMILIYRSGHMNIGFRAKIWSNSPKPPTRSLPLPVLKSRSFSPKTTESSTTSVVIASTARSIAPTTTLQTRLISANLAKKIFIATYQPSTTSNNLIWNTKSLSQWVTKLKTLRPSSTAATTTIAHKINELKPNKVDETKLCECEEWTEWQGACSQECGGCGKRSRERLCSGTECRTIDKRTCNYQACPSGTNFLINNGEFHVLWKGCCIGLFRFNSNCSTLDDAQFPLLTILGSFFSSNDAKRIRTGDIALYKTKNIRSGDE